jgi:type I restriction enzyme R subunit
LRLPDLDKPNIGLLSDEFLEDVRQMESRNLAVELLEKLLRDEIKARARNNVVQEKKYGDRLLETLRKYHNRAIETAQVIEELIQMAKEFQAVLEREAALGLGQDEIAFYDALANNESAVRELGDDILKKIAIEITEKLRASTTVDWQVRESVRARLRILRIFGAALRGLQNDWKYPGRSARPALPMLVELVLQAGCCTRAAGSGDRLGRSTFSATPGCGLAGCGRCAGRPATGHAAWRQHTQHAAGRPAR